MDATVGEGGPHARGAAGRLRLDRDRRDLGQPARRHRPGGDRAVGSRGCSSGRDRRRCSACTRPANHGFLIRDAAGERRRRRADDQQPRQGERRPAGARAGLRRQHAGDDDRLRARRRRRTSTAASFTFSSDRADATFECSLDGAAFAACTSPHTRRRAGGRRPQPARCGRRGRSGRSTRRRRATTWTVAIPPETSDRPGRTSPSASADATLTLLGRRPRGDVRVLAERRRPSQAARRRSSTRTWRTASNEVRVRATDPLGNVEPSPAVHAWTVAVPPETTIDSGPPALGNSTSASFEFSGTDNGPAPPPLAFECRLDSGDWAACSSPQDYVDLADGEHTFEVRATDAAGNTRAGAGVARLDGRHRRAGDDDRRGPAATLGNELGGDLRVQRGRGGRASSAGSTRATGLRAPARRAYAELADGAHTFEVRGDRPGGQRRRARPPTRGRSTRWRRRRRSTAAPADPSNDRAPSFAFSANEAASLRVPARRRRVGRRARARRRTPPRRTASTPSRCGRPTPPATREPRRRLHLDGGHRRARATDDRCRSGGAGNGAEASFPFSADEAADVRVQLDAGDWAACDEPAGVHGRLADGAHTFEVRATDGRATSTRAASFAWTVDTVAPETTIDSGAAGSDNDSAPSFAFSANEAAELRVQAGRGRLGRLHEPAGVRRAGRRRAHVPVRATDLAGNSGASGRATRGRSTRWRR